MVKIDLSAESRDELLQAVQNVGEQFNIMRKKIPKTPNGKYYKAYIFGDVSPVLGSNMQRKTPLNTDI